MRVAVFALIAGCSSSAAAPNGPPAPATISPLAMAGPYKTIVEACTRATPCGGTAYDPKNPLKVTKPPKTAACPTLAPDGVDPNSIDPSGKRAVLAHDVGDLQIRIASQTCAQPPGSRWEHNVYYAFVRRGGSWWRSAPLWQFDYNDKYEGGTLLVRWNDRPGRTFAGIAAKLDSGACMKQGSESSTLELMVRVEPGTAAPIVFAPLVVGERFQRVVDAGAPDDIDCKPVKRSYELAEKWASDDELELSGPASWFATRFEDGAIAIGLDSTVQKPSSAGRYTFVR